MVAPGALLVTGLDAGGSGGHDGEGGSGGHEDGEDNKVSCMNNHGGPNCSTAFGISNGRCTFDATVCMDYNGWGTDCINGKVSNFFGSDCFSALLKGHCWNEVM